MTYSGFSFNRAPIFTAGQAYGSAGWLCRHGSLFIRKGSEAMKSAAWLPGNFLMIASLSAFISASATPEQIREFVNKTAANGGHSDFMLCFSK